MNQKKAGGMGVIIAIVAIGLLVVGCAVTGILAAIAIPTFVGFVHRSKTAEATGNLRSLARAVERYCDSEVVVGTGIGSTVRERGLPAATGPIPRVPGPSKQVVTREVADDPVFSALGFTLNEPVYYSYRIESAGTDAVLLKAVGDLDGDGTQSLFEIRCALAPGGGCSCDPSVRTERENE